MNVRAAQTGYGTAQKNVGTPRAVEARVLAQVTRALAIADESRETDFLTFVTALNANADLWRVFAQDLASPENQLPLELRRSLFALAGFVHDETGRILSSSRSAADLCTINRDILVGLCADQSVQVAP